MSSDQYPCEPGKYNPNTLQNDSSACVDCDAGSYCDVFGIGDITSKKCAAGFYCVVGSVVSKPVGPNYEYVCKRG